MPFPLPSELYDDTVDRNEAMSSLQETRLVCLIRNKSSTFKWNDQVSFYYDIIIILSHISGVTSLIHHTRQSRDTPDTTKPQGQSTRKVCKCTLRFKLAIIIKTVNLSVFGVGLSSAQSYTLL